MPEYDDNPDDPRVKEAISKMVKGIESNFLNEDITMAMADRLEEFISHGLEKIRQKFGVRLPPLVAVIFPSQGAIRVLRKDLSRDEMESYVLAYAQGMEGITSEELAEAFGIAFPQHRPH